MFKYFIPFFLTAFLLAPLPSTTAFAATIKVGNDKNIRSLSQINWSSIKPGDEVVIDSIINNSVVIVTAKGTATKPIIIRNANNSTPIIKNSIVVQDAHHVIFDGLTVRNSKHSGFIIRQGAKAITVQNSIIHDNGLGIWIGDGSKDEHRLMNNKIFNNSTHGIAIDVINAREGHETIISGNQIYQNGIHGIEINGNRYIVEYNVVSKNGQSMSGISGIHTFARNEDQDAGDYNIIRYNISYGNIDKDGQDGNGIQLDQWCDNNQVYNNIVFGNDGAGINIYDGANNDVFNNTLYDNMKDPGNTHIYKGELVIASDFTENIDHSRNNKIINNIIYATNKKNVAILVDKLSIDNNLTIANNILFHQDKGANLWSWGYVPGKNNGFGKDINTWNSNTGYTNFYADPLFINPQEPLNHGLKLRKASPARAKGLETISSTDLDNNPIGQIPDLGAYYQAN